MVEGDGKGARDLRTRVTERDRRVSLVGLATNRVFNGEPFAFNPLSPCDLILLQSQDRRNPVHYIYISIPFICHRIGLPERLMVADIELNFSNLTRLDGDISFLPWIPRFSSIWRENGRSRVGEKELETGETGKTVARTLMRMEKKKKKKKKKFWLIAGAQLFPWRHLEDTRISIFPSSSSSGDPRKSNLSTPLFLHIT